MKKQYLFAFAAISIVHLLGLLADMELMARFTKPLLMPLLALWFITETPNISSTLRGAWIAGLFFSFLGDIFLMYDGTLFFILGLLGFLMAHLCYITALTRGMRGRSGFLLRNPLWALPFLIYPVLMLIFLWPGIPEGMRVPVAVYALVISSMAQSVLNVRTYVPGKTFGVLMAGAVLFVMSDSMLALNKFVQPFPGNHVAIMLTYIGGQWLLTKGVSELLGNSVKTDS